MDFGRAHALTVGLFGYAVLVPGVAALAAFLTLPWWCADRARRRRR